jgi:2-amino-4-hydroxy-6-hydroxymethyldihydropteridine diphosphokinase
MSRAVLSLGSNLGDREGNIRSALKSLALLPGTAVVKASSLYETDPVGCTDQPVFLNAAVLVDTGLSPRALLGACLGIEAALGRVRRFKNGPRTIDIDILVYEDAVSDENELTLPHPRLRERAFVLVPLGEMFPDGNVLGVDLSREIESVRDVGGVRKYGGLEV